MRIDLNHSRTLAGGTRRQRVVSASSMILAFCLATVMVPASFAVQDEDGGLPGPEALVDLGTLVGEWGMSGVTSDGEGTDVDGRMFRARQSVEWIEPGRSLGVVWSVMLEDGTTITSGRGRINWDDIAGAVVNTYRGEENGRSFTGSATLIEAAEGVFDWRGHETSGTSESVNFEVTYAFPDNDLCMVDFIPTCVDGDVVLDPARFSWARINPFHEAMPLAPDLIGDWVLRSGGSDSMPDGSLMTVRHGRGDRSLFFMVVEAGEEGGVIGSEILWFDDATGELGDRSTGADGIVQVGTPSLAMRNGRPALRVAWDGEWFSSEDRTSSSESMSIVSWLTLDANRMDVAFSGIEEGGYEIDDGVRTSMIWERTGR